MNDSSHSVHNPLIGFLEQFSEGNMRLARPKLEVEFDSIRKDIAGVSGNDSTDSVLSSLDAVQKSPERASVIALIPKISHYCVQQLESSRTPDKVRNVKRIVFHLLQITRLVAHRPSQENIKSLARKLTSEDYVSLVKLM